MWRGLSLYRLVFLAQVIFADQTADLTALYNSAGGSSWQNGGNANWLNGDPCGNSWAGITCSGGTVVKVNLDNCGLQGSIPDSFGTGLTQVTELHITFNYQGNTGYGSNFQGLYNTPLPSGLSSMTKMIYLYINSNDFSGNIPDLSGMVNLQQADFEYNRLTGFANPGGLSVLTYLQALKLYRNFFASVPSSFTSMSTCTSIRVSDIWAGITCSGGVVTIINLDKFALQGSIPDAFGAGLTQVTELHITFNYQGNTGYGSNFQGLYNTPLPSGLSSMTKMIYLYINSNDFSGNIPDLSGMVNLQQADFEYNRLTGFANPGGLSVLTYLQALKLYRNFFASVPSSFTSMSTCTSIRMECNKLTSTVDPGIWSMPNVKELSFGFQVRGDQYAVYNPTGNRVPGIVPKSISTKTLLDLSGNAFDEFEDYTMGSPLGSGATCDMSSKGSPSGPNFACPIPGWASSSCSASCSCYTPTTSSVSGNPPNAGGDIVITGRYWGEDAGERLTETQRNAKCDSGWKDMHIQVIDSHDHHVYSPCMSECTEHGKCSCQVGILRLHVECSYDDIPGSHDIIYNVFNDIIYNIFHHINDEGDDIHNVDDQAHHIDNIVYHVDNIIHYVDNKAGDLYNIINLVDNIIHYVDNEANDINHVDNIIHYVDNEANDIIFPSTFTTSSTTSSIPSTSSTTIATTTDIPFCDQIFLSFNRSLSSSVLQDQLRGMQPLAMQCPEQLSAVVLQIASTNLQRNKTFVVEAGNISIAAGKMNLVFSSNAASGLIPSDVADLLPVNSSAILSLYTFNPYVTSSSIDTVQYTNLVSLSVTSLNGTEIHVHNTSSAIEIGMDYNAVDGYEIECVWWDNSTRGWNREGCTTDTSSQPVKCLCSHLTSFSLQVTPKEVLPSEIAAKPFPWKWVGIGVGGFVFLLAVVMVVIAVLTRRRWKRREEYDLGMQSISHVIPADQIEVTEHLSTRIKRGRYQLADVVVVRQQSGDGLSEHLLQRVRHVNIVQYLGCYSDSVGDKYFVYNYVAGIELSKWMTATEYDNDMAEHLVMQLANVMTYLIDQGVTDNIVTAEKVIIQPDNKGYVLKLWDLRPNVQRPELYVPPEKKLRTETAQVWAFGILSMQIIEKTLYPQEYYDDKEIPDSLTLYAVKQSLRKIPERRPKFMDICRTAKVCASPKKRSFTSPYFGSDYM
ncbi:RHS repeat-associated core domain-containing protein [Planoprotostelium fungivorum]|uniref:RHS repeat-associated core domain-containing protein n=1 Tax=Planoprotostelium fungivorum TaxID=1890364 RepID=A0A2P6N276_9EUKA|nr:RHS repeat-associated core domain-containing protein [Planoprotostelium fungivorum]